MPRTQVRIAARMTATLLSFVLLSAMADAAVVVIGSPEIAVSSLNEKAVRNLYLGKNIPIGGTAHQAGTARFGRDPATSVLDLDCKCHELDNLYVADASFFPSIGSVNPTLTIVANALRVADKIAGRLGANGAIPDKASRLTQL